MMGADIARRVALFAKIRRIAIGGSNNAGGEGGAIEMSANLLASSARFRRLSLGAFQLAKTRTRPGAIVRRSAGQLGLYASGNEAKRGPELNHFHERN